VTQQSPLFFAGLGEFGDETLWDHQDVLGGLRVDVPKGNAVDIFVDDVRRGLPAEDFSKNRGVGGVVVLIHGLILLRLARKQKGKACAKALFSREFPQPGFGQGSKLRSNLGLLQKGGVARMKIAVTGGTGFVGKALVEELIERGEAVTVVSRTPEKLPVPFHGLVSASSWEDLSLDGFDAVINLAGENLLGHRWSEEHKQKIRDSRIDTTRRIVDLCRIAKDGPKVLVQASAVGFYGPREDDLELDEASPAGKGFLAEVCQEWEEEASKVRALGVRMVPVRIGVVLGRGGGALERMAPVFRKNLGGKIGNGKQWISWIHMRDLVRMMVFVLDHGQASGPWNGTAPNPVQMKAFAEAIGKALGKPAWLPAPAFALKIALGEGAEIVLTGQRVLPREAQKQGFVFEYPRIDAALEEIFAEEVVP
jgi:uncharacterized protein (TIGR01777 family)